MKIVTGRERGLLGGGFLKLWRNDMNNCRVQFHLTQNRWIHRNSDLEIGREKGSLRKWVFGVL